MTYILTTPLVKIGNSQGICIPKPLLEQVGMTGDVQIGVESDRLILRPATRARQGWEEQFKRVAELGDDKLLDGGSLVLTQWEEAEWEW